MCSIPLFHHCRGVVVKMGAMYKTLQGDKVSFNAKEVWVYGKSHLKQDELKCWLRSSGMKKELQHLVCGRCLTLCSLRRRCLALLQPVRPWFTQLDCCRVTLGDLPATAVSNVPPCRQLTWLRHVSGGGPCSEETHGSAAAVWHSTLFTRRIRL